MSETVLQSFCERCGTRYTSTVPESKPAAEEGRGVLARFGRRSSKEKPPEPEPTPSSTDPSSDHFAGTFHFCMDCRQYTCSKCWNAEGGACLSCQPRSQPGATPAGGTSAPKPFAARASSAWTADRALGADESVQPPAASTGDTPAASTGDTPAASLFGAPAGEVDPWRGVVFSSEEAAAAGADREPDSAPTIDFAAQRGAPSAPEAWPEVDRPSKAEPEATPGASVWPQVDRQEEPVEEAAHYEPEAEPVAEAQTAPVDEPEPVEVEPVAEPEPEIEPVAEPEPEVAFAE
ncbi:MAG: hypothetical protein PVH07_03650, partial [Chloroflexota bacterium]